MKHALDETAPSLGSAAHSLPGSNGEHTLQARFGSTTRAQAFYAKQVLDYLNPEMQRFIARQEMVFVATSDAAGDCDCSFRAGLAGFVRVKNERVLLYPEYRGNGVMASLGNLEENAHIGLLFVDFFEGGIGLHVNGGARRVEHEELLAQSGLPSIIRSDAEVAGGRRPERWVVVHVQEAYIHCSKHIPLLRKLNKDVDWGTDDMRKKGGDYFGAKRSPRAPAVCAGGLHGPDDAKNE